MRGIVRLAAPASALGLLITPGATAGPAAPTWSPSTDGAYDFGWLPVGQSVSQRFTLSNPGTSSSGTVTIELKGSSAFTLVADGCTDTNLAAKSKCTVRVAYSPSSAEAHDSATLFAVGAKEWQASLALTGSGIAAGSGHVYWGNAGTNSVGRAGLDGSNPDPSFIGGDPGANEGLEGVAVDPGYVYWTNDLGPYGTIGRAGLDGSNPNQSFTTTRPEPAAVAVDANHVYWANIDIGAIGRADLDGSNPDQTFITGAYGLEGVAVDSHHVYWTNSLGNTIGRANLNGSNVNQNFITGADAPTGVAVNAAHVYWTNRLGNSIGRANLDGSHKKQSFISGARGPQGVAVGGGHIYWTNTQTNRIGRANLDGSHKNQSFITGLSEPIRVAVGPI